jgi:Ca2+-binding RTX toxin-like protein
MRIARGPVTVDLEAGFAQGDGSDTLTSIEDVDGSRFPDRLLGDDGPNRILGWYADAEDEDHIEGRGGDDELFGSRGDDVLLGGEGRDRLDGQFDTDRCFGGEELVDCEVTARDEGTDLILLLMVALSAAAVVAVVLMRRRRTDRGS